MNNSQNPSDTARESGRNEVLETIFFRESVRAYSDRPVTHEQLETLVKAAMSAPSAVNRQPWAFIVVDDRPALDVLADKLPYAKMAANAPAAVIVCGDLEKIPGDSESSFWVQDCAAASENLLLAAAAMGLGAVWTAVYPVEERLAVVRKLFGLPHTIVPLNVIPVGYPLHDEKPKDKFRPENIHWNRW